MAQNPDDTAGTVVEDIEQPVTQPVATPPEDDDAHLEDHAIEAGGKKLVPLEEVAKLRDKRRADKQRLDTLEQQVQQLQPWQTFGEQAKPIIEALQRRPELVQALQTGQVPASKTTKADEGDETLVTLAKSLDLYDAQGQPDVGRAKTVQALVEQTATRVADQRVTPLATSTAKDKSALNFQKMSQFKAPSGEAIDPSTLQAVWQLVPAEESAKDEVAQVLLLAAAGYQRLFNKTAPKVQASEHDPVMVEAAGGKSVPIRLTTWQNKAAQDMGKSAADFAKGIKEVIDKGGQLE